MRLGKPGTRGNPLAALIDPTAVLTDAANGDVYRESQGREGDDIHTSPHGSQFLDGAMGEGVAIDDAGNIYSAEAQLRGVTKFVKQ